MIRLSAFRSGNTISVAAKSVDTGGVARAQGLSRVLPPRNEGKANPPEGKKKENKSANPNGEKNNHPDNQNDPDR